METRNAYLNGLLDHSVQVNDGLTQTSGDGPSLVFDKKYGIMFCTYMPGFQGHYGESRGKIALSYFPASQPTNIRFVDVVTGNDVYCPTSVGLGDGKVRVIYEKDSRMDGDHRVCYKDFDFLTGQLSEENMVMVRCADGSLTPLCQSVVFAYLDSRGLHNHKYCITEQYATTGIFTDEEGVSYSCYTSLCAEPVLYRSQDHMATVEFFAAYPAPAEYEFVYRFLNGTIHALFRTPPERNSIFYTTSSNMGKTWTAPVLLEDSVSCRPSMLCYNGHILMAYNYFNPDTKNRPEIQQGRTTIRFRYGEDSDPNRNPLVAELYRKGGMVNIGITEILGDIYLAYSTSELALEYQNGNPKVRGKDSVRYVKLGDLTPELSTRSGNETSYMKIDRENYTVSFSEPQVYVDNKSRKRSGHMTHALAEWAPGKLIDFNSNCSGVKYKGHSTFGWVEYRLSEDGGETYSDIYELPYAKQTLYDGIYDISVERAVACDDGRIVAICLRNDADALCEPWDTPMTVTSFDGGKTWTEAKELCPYKGRVYDACYYDGVIYALEFCNDAVVHFCGNKPEHLYRIFTSHNKGESFEELCVVPLPTEGRGYGSLLFDDKGLLHVYAYNINNEQYMDHVISPDRGQTWQEATTCFVDDGIRNPQTAQLDGIYILHGRNCRLNREDFRTGFVFYTSEDGQNWDKGTRLAEVDWGGCYYSNNIILKDKDGSNRMLVQYSETYGVENCVDVKHVWLKVEKK